MAHPLSGAFNYQSANIEELETRAQRALDALHDYQDAIAGKNRSEIKDIKIAPIAVEDTQAIAIYASIAFQGFNQTQVDTKLSRDWLGAGAQIEALTNSEDKLCTVMHAVLQTASIGLIGQENQGRDTLVANHKWIMEQAAAGHAQCMRVLSFMHGRGGIGVPRSWKDAIQLLQDCSDNHDDAFANTDLGLAYSGQFERVEDPKLEHLRQIKVDNIKAAQFFQRAASAGHSDAQRELGILIINAFYNDIPVSIKLAEMIAAEPDADKKAKLGQLQDAKFGMVLLEQSAKQGRISAMYSMGRAYQGIPAFKGVVARDIPTAVQWLKQADERGFPRASLELAGLYQTWFDEMGENHPDHNKANAYIIYDFLLGRPRTVNQITVSTQPLTPPQITEAEKHRKGLEEEAVWERMPNGNRKLVFNDGTSLIFSPQQNDQDPSKDVPYEMAKASAHETGINGHAKNVVEAIYIYKDLLARKEGGEATMPTAQQMKTIQDRLEVLVTQAQQQGNQVVVNPANGSRLLVLKNVDGKPFVNIHLEAHKNWAKQQADKAAKELKAAERAAREAAKAGGTTAPSRPADQSKPKPKGGNDKKGGPNG